METKVTVAPTGNEIIIREGKAETIYEPRKVHLQGDINAPGAYFNSRWEPQIKHLKDRTHLVVDQENLSLQLVVNEADHHAVIVEGKMEFFKEFLSFNINRQKNYTIAELYKMLRLKRAYFKDRSAHAAILDQLKKFEAKTEVEFKNLNDFKGSTAMQKIQVCKTNLSYNFVLEIPIYKGLPAMQFPVEIEFEPNDGSIICWLISEDVAELEVKQRDEVIAAEIEKFKGIAIIKK
jgi:hypothetical protein